MSGDVLTAARRLSKKDADNIASIRNDAEAKRGRLSTREQGEEVVERSRPKGSPTHHLFDWDDRRVAEEARVQQAIGYIASIRIVFASQPEREPVRAFPVCVVDGKRGPYPMGQVLKRPSLTETMLQQALAEVESWRKRYDNLRELAGVFREVDKVVRKTKGKEKAKKAA